MSSTDCAHSLDDLDKQEQSHVHNIPRTNVQSAHGPLWIDDGAAGKMLSERPCSLAYKHPLLCVCVSRRCEPDLCPRPGWLHRGQQQRVVVVMMVVVCGGASSLLLSCDDDQGMLVGMCEGWR
jgi:hypothetical protein